MANKQTFFSLSLLAISIFPSHIHALDPIEDAFIVKNGNTEGGCTDYMPQLSSSFNEALKIVDTARAAFDEYSTSYQTRKLALSFFNVQMNDQMTAPRDATNQEILTQVQDNFKEIQGLMRPASFMGSAQFNADAPRLFCDSTFLKMVEATDDFLARNENTGRIGPRGDAGGGDKFEIYDEDAISHHLSVAEAFRDQFSIPNIKPFYSPDMVRYRFGVDDMTQDCNNRKTAGFSSVMNPQDKAMIICTNNGWRGADSLDTSKGVGTWLGDIESKSLTFIHEIVHLIPIGPKTQDLNKQLPPPSVSLANDDGTPNVAGWPGNPNNFIEKPGDPADSTTEILLLALAQGKPLIDQPPLGGRQVDVKFNPQNFAWAATAAYLARNGAMLDYSTGKAEEITQGPPMGPALPATPPTKH